MAFKFQPLSPNGEVTLVMPDTYGDHRGFFRETYKTSAFREGGIEDVFTQGNLSLSSRGVMRGLHFQTAPAEVAKLISVAHGSLFDVAVDVRPDSPDFGKWYAETLTAENGYALYVGRGFAHGFVALEDDTVASYLMAGEFSPDHDAAVRFSDPEIGIEWPIDIADMITTEKDANAPLLSELR